MHISNIANRPAGIQLNSGNPQSASGSGFQLPSSSLRTVAAPPTNISRATSLGSQTVSTLLQTQDLNDIHSHGGGGGHHGMKMLPTLEAEEVIGSEETQYMQRRKKLLKTTLMNGVSESEETEEENSELENEKDNPEKNSYNRL